MTPAGHTHGAVVAALRAGRAQRRPEPSCARLVEAVGKTAEEKGVTVADVFAGKPKQLRVFEAQQRNVNRFGEAHRPQVVTLHKLARAAGLALVDVYGEEELAAAWEHKDLRVDDRVRGWDLVLDLPKSDSVLQGLMDALDERQLRDLVHEAKTDTFRQVERWAGYAVGSEDREPVRPATGGLSTPRPRGWSARDQLVVLADDVDPAPAGMVRSRGRPGPLGFGRPRARGDGPCQSETAENFAGSTPRPRGWSLSTIRGKAHLLVDPAPAGMVRVAYDCCTASSGRPRARGDGPST